MAYQSLYRRYRPRRFSEVRGQEHVVRALRNAVRDERVGHAYLFSGPRGTGKTSTARILAKALNCEHLVDGEPCGNCESCLAIDAGTSYDVQELDAASNNGVQDVRDLVGRVNLGSPGRTKVYILDEVHMLTAAASAALLKTLEEPPGHVVFVLATTDPQKVLPTIRSRTQHYDFHLLSVDELAEHVAWVIHDADLGLDPDVIDHVVRAGAGSARDTLSALDQVSAAGGVVDRGEALDDLLDAIASADAGRALVAVADAVAAGRDPRILGEAVLARLRDVFLVRMGGATGHIPSGDIDRITAWAEQLGDRATTRALEAVGDALLEMRQAPDPRIPLEVALVKLTRADSGASIGALTERVARLEAALAAGGAPAPAGAPPAAGSGAGPGPSAPPSPAPGPRPERTPPPPRPGGRPADQARAELAARRSEPAVPPAAPAPPSARRAAPPTEPAPSDPAPSAPAPSGPAPSGPAQSDPAPSAPAAPERAAGAGDLSLEQLESIWSTDILGQLRGVTKAMYQAGEFKSLDGLRATFALPNEVHRQKCDQKRSEVEAALTARIGSPVVLDLVVGADISNPATRKTEQRRPAAAPPPDDYDALEGASVEELDDAPDAAIGGIDALHEAFPGAELLEEP